MSAIRKPRVAQIVTRMDVGGVPDHVLTLTRGLLLNHDVTLICGAIDPRHAAALAAMGVEVVMAPFSRLPDPLRDLRAVRALRALMVARRFDIIHTHMSKAALAGVVAARLIRPAAARPLVVNTAHNLGSLALSHPLLRRLFKVYDRMLLGGACDAVIVVSERVRARALALGLAPPDKLFAIPNGIATERFAPDQAQAAVRRAALNVAPGETLILTVARLVWFKGLDVLIDALALIARRRPGAKLVIVGAGPLRAALEQRAQALGVGDRVTFTGERSDVPQLLAAADIFALTSVSEGMPISILEAMASGLAVAATEVGGVGELVRDGETGLLTPPRDPAAFAAALEKLIADPALRARMGAGGRARVEAEFTGPAMTARTAALYEQALERRRRLPKGDAA
ncbi:MAG: hypothetical protein COW75_04030 [Rhodobacterales bacterium CG18_big_fil_WC_8_21_14_2_50_71_9]|nr:MAG: hypothetical protein COW75_04030 [Rhodobacterales bacterium CG18_big_fil_WC_8_21_14_2_50_71_9]PIY75249.1 MAG: hypothetical protein COY86_00370 [Rhodobacterales bacterium CG_4_10_14_0_8_um_filter_70_9]PJA59451.1 MAG: hypothetical protein CO163_09360 [Rhodobacterales bacterium CG_4_9_14_3_um_filter_71_31]